DFKAFDDPAAAHEWLSRYKGDYPLVIKADGLAAGKGVLICENEKEARDAVRRVMVNKDFGKAGDWLLIEEFLQGEEASVLAFCDGHRAVLMPPARDYKRALDGDRGLNTGGMGAYSPTSHIHPALLEEIETTIIQPVLDGIRREGAPYRGVLYAGLMLTENGPKLLEINCRFGDPETQVVLPRLYSDLFPVLLACARGDLGRTEIQWADVAAVTVVLCSGGYPGAYKKGLEIKGLEDAARQEGVIVFHAGTRREGDKVLTAGGRVLNVTALGSNLETARKRAYEAAGRIRFEGMQLRTDIALNA
ncbi:MAG: phosphoribosylamine--glycine ligase, partial [Acidobacteriota bacterium]